MAGAKGFFQVNIFLVLVVYEIRNFEDGGSCNIFLTAMVRQLKQVTSKFPQLTVLTEGN
jgi:hypothetical protein